MTNVVEVTRFISRLQIVPCSFRLHGLDVAVVDGTILFAPCLLVARSVLSESLYLFIVGLTLFLAVLANIRALLWAVRSHVPFLVAVTAVATEFAWLRTLTRKVARFATAVQHQQYVLSTVQITYLRQASSPPSAAAPPDPPTSP
jgi:predicted ferric reductase